MRLEDIKGVGPKTKNKLNKAGIQTMSELLFYFPVKYEEFQLNDFSEIDIEKDLTLLVKVVKRPKIYFIRKHLDKLTVQVEIANMFFYVSIFNRRFMASVLLPDTEIVITGRFIKNYSNFTASNIVLKKNFSPGIKPIYNMPDINNSSVIKILNTILRNKLSLEEIIPEKYLKKHNIPNINDLIYSIHQPKSEVDIFNARKRIIYEELLMFSIKIEALKKLNKNIISQSKKYNIDIVKEFIKNLPFELTDDQKISTNEIFKDLKNNRQMNRLLQGDVGSGKTIVSIIASLAVVTAGYQVAIMAPTLVLAKQHYNTFCNYLKRFNINVTLLVSDLTKEEKNSALNKIKSNETNIVVGTHSLIQEDVEFKNLGFLVIDEQHRFGVEQRRFLRNKGVTPDILLMSATPIPRTLAISIYKDIDLSFIKEKPAGRKTIKTDIIEYELLDELLTKIQKELDLNHQAYFICPKITESDTSHKISVEEMYQTLTAKLGNKYSIAVLHGKLKDDEKTQILKRFYANEIKILISTTVVEVGVNVKNATVMTIMNANVFGLSQLHQLRGRIGRNEYQSYCYLVVDDIMESQERLKILEDTDDGFLISEYDLSIRGPGEVFGNSQSGIPDFKMANLIKNQDILNQALEDASEIVASSNIHSKKLTNKAIKTIDSYNLD